MIPTTTAHITTADALKAFCDRAAHSPILCIDTEFLREKTYFPQLCLIQASTMDEAVTIDPLAEGMELKPLLHLFTTPHILKIMHSARQDLEIFHQDFQTLPRPLFDTQIAAMVCGFGEQVGYGRLVEQILGKSIDKTQQFTDWARRPLNEKQLTYALADVLYLPTIYHKLCAELGESGRDAWIVEETEQLLDPALYTPQPETAWERLKLRTTAPRFISIVQHLSRWREEVAVRQNIPRGWVLKDDTLLEIAAEKPKTVDDLTKLRVPPARLRKNERAELIELLQQVLAIPDDQLPRSEEKPKKAAPKTALTDLLKLLLKARAEAHGVAPKMIGNSEEVEALAAEDDPDSPLLHGWRFQLFGQDALRLKRGEISLGVNAKGELVCLESTKHSS